MGLNFRNQALQRRMRITAKQKEFTYQPQQWECFCCFNLCKREDFDCGVCAAWPNGKHRQLGQDYVLERGRRGPGFMGRYMGRWTQEELEKYGRRQERFNPRDPPKGNKWNKDGFYGWKWGE